MKIKALVLVALLLSLSLTAFAQTSRGTVSGTAVDQAGAVIAGATVTLTNIDTNVSSTTTTNNEGFYRFDAVLLGNYSVNIAATGFGTITKTNVVVNANQTSTVDVQLAPGAQTTTVEVTAQTGAELQTESPVRGGNISTQQITDLPFAGRNPTALALTLPGVSSNRFGFGISTFSVNGARGRSNNFLLDGIENNDTSIAGQGFRLTNPDAVQEVSVQTSNFDAEFGRAGGGVINTITKSGTNDFHGTLSGLLDSTVDDAITSQLARDPEIRRRGRLFRGTEQIYAGTVGGPLFLPRFGEGGKAFRSGRDRTFFFASYQEDRQNSDGSFQFNAVPSQAGRDRLRQLFPVGTNPRVDLLLAVTAGTVANNSFNDIDLGSGRGNIQVGGFLRTFASVFRDRQSIVRVDHKISENDQFTGRFIYGDNINPNGGESRFAGFEVAQINNTKNIFLNEVHVFSPSLTNDLRVGYGRIRFGFPVVGDNPLVDIPRFDITNVSSIGIATNLPQGRLTNNYVFQDTATYVRGDHTFRFGADLNKQRNKQDAPFLGRGLLSFTSSNVTVPGTGAVAFTGLANFVDDFGGGGTAARDFGSPSFSPEPFRQSYFFQDRYKATQSLTLTLGLRYDNFGVPANALATPAFTGLFNVDPVTLTGPFSRPNKVKQDNNNFGPTVGIAYSPKFQEGILGRLLGENRTVLRAGYQISYDSFFDNITSNAKASSPNIIGTQAQNATANAANPRGLANLSSLFPTTPRPLSPTDGQTLIDPNLVAPYYQKFSVGIQRQLPFNIVADISYVGNKGTKLYSNADLNPLVPASLRITPAGVPSSFVFPGRLDNIQGARLTRVNGASSIYHSGQVSVTRRFVDNFTITGNYTYSKLIDNASEVFGSSGNSSPQNPARPTILFSERLDRAVSLFDKTHRASFTYVIRSPFFKSGRGALGHILGGFELSGVTTLESGAPLNVFNGINADQIGGNFDRPDFNPSGQRNVRAIPATTTSPSATGFINPDVIVGTTSSGANIFAPIDPATARYIGVPANTSFRTGNLGRNTLRTPGTNLFDVNILKRTHISENTSLEFRTEIYNIFNHPNFVQGSLSPFTPASGSIPADVFNSQPGTFLNPDTQFSDGGGRIIRYQLKFIF